MTSGILNVDKPKGMTSHGVVKAVRRVTGIRKVGHAGALDPMATGVLVVCIGRATRLAEYLTFSIKGYQATVRLGVKTDTYDADGQVVDSAAVAAGRQQVEAELARFSGAIEQVPPMYSALKRKGEPLYKLARQGITVEREARPAVIYQIGLTDWSPPHFSFEVTCSAGTYVRSIAHDLGEALGCGAHLTRLNRVRSGEFSIEEAVPLGDLTPANWESWLQPIERAVASFPQINVDSEAYQSLVHGQPIPRLPEHPVADLAQVHTDEVGFFALVKPSPEGTAWLPHKVFVDS